MVRDAFKSKGKDNDDSDGCGGIATRDADGKKKAVFDVNGVPLP